MLGCLSELVGEVGGSRLEEVEFCVYLLALLCRFHPPGPCWRPAVDSANDKTLRFFIDQ